MRFLSLLLILSSGYFFGINHTYGQIKIKGVIIDDYTFKPIFNSHIFEDSGSNAVVSDSLGNFQIEVPSLPAFLSFSHLSYHPKAIMIQSLSEEGLRVELTSRNFEINEVVVMAERIQKFFQKESFYVREMEFGDGFLWLIGYPDKNILKPELRVLSLGGASLSKMDLKRAGFLFKDAFGNAHIVYDDVIVQLYWDGESIIEVNHFPRDGSEENLFNLQTIFDSLAILKVKVGTGVYNEFIAFSFIDSSQYLMHQSFDHKLFASSNLARDYKFGSIPDVIFPPFGGSSRDRPSFDPTDGFTSYAQDKLLTYTPINSKLLRIENELIIFEDKGPFLWKYGLDLQFIEMLAIQVPDNSTKINLLQDPVTSLLYLLFEIKGIEYISKLDIKTGALNNTMQLDGFTFVDNIRVYGNRVYYLDQSKTGAQKMNLFSMAIE